MYCVPFFLQMPEDISPAWKAINGLFRVKKSRKGIIYGALNLRDGWEQHIELQEVIDLDNNLAWKDDETAFAEALMYRIYENVEDSALPDGRYGPATLSTEFKKNIRGEGYSTRNLYWDEDNFSYAKLQDFIKSIGGSLSSWYG